ncbi:MAG: BatD family protein [Proteobacteria bacterium]|nr:BatD family protein [Pseudomonadota bacterium]
MNAIKRIKYILAIILSIAWTVSVWAESIDVEKLTDSCIVGESLFFRVTVHLDEEKEIDVSDVKMSGAPLSYNESQSSSSSFSFTINGRTIKQASGLEKSFVFEVPAEKTGVIIVPSATIKIGEKPYTIESQTFMVHEKPVSDNFKLIVKIANPNPVYYPTQIIEINCRLYYRDFQGSPSDLQYDLPILADNHFLLIPDPEAPKGYVVINNQKFGINYDQGTEKLGGKEYNVFFFKLKFRLMNAGEFSFNNSVKAQVETGRVMRQRGFFGTELVREKKTIFAESPVLNIHVQALPKENVPQEFNGAIGDFKIRVIPSSDTDIKIGDPITLSIEISGRGSWEFVKCPPVDKMPALTDYFIISSDPVAGVVSEDGSRKTFIVRMRVKSKTVKQIPPIPFTFFNLVKNEYITVHSDPVPIKVFDSSGNVEVVDFGKPPEEQGADAQKLSDQGDLKSQEPSKSAAPVQNDLPELIPIRDNVNGPILEQDHSPGYKGIFFSLIPIFLIGMIWIIQKIRNMNVSEKRLAKIRQRTAYQIFKNAISHLERKNPDETIFYRDLGQHILHFLENRFLVKIDDIDTNLIQNFIKQNRISSDLGDSLMAKFERIQHLRYSKEQFNPKEARTILKNVKEVLKKC